MRIHITDDNGHKLSFSALQMKEWSHSELAKVLKEVVEILESPMVEDRELINSLCTIHEQKTDLIPCFPFDFNVN